MTLQIYFPDKKFEFSPLPPFNLSLQKCTEVLAQPFKVYY